MATPPRPSRDQRWIAEAEQLLALDWAGRRLASGDVSRLIIALARVTRLAKTYESRSQVCDRCAELDKEYGDVTI